MGDPAREEQARRWRWRDRWDRPSIAEEIAHVIERHQDHHDPAKKVDRLEARAHLSAKYLDHVAGVIPHDDVRPLIRSRGKGAVCDVDVSLLEGRQRLVEIVHDYAVFTSPWTSIRSLTAAPPVLAASRYRSESTQRSAPSFQNGHTGVTCSGVLHHDSQAELLSVPVRARLSCLPPTARRTHRGTT